MIPNTNDGSQSPPRMKLDLNLGTLEDLPSWSTGPRDNDVNTRLEAVRAAGYDGIQAGPELVSIAQRHGLTVTAGGRIDQPGEADELARKLKDSGVLCCTLHVGTGLESEGQADALCEAIIEASIRHAFPLYIETHRATLTQDCYRTLQLIERHPDLRLNGDFSHWYTGLEMVYGDWAWKLTTQQPVFDRVRFIHGRIGNPSSMQVDVGDGQAGDPKRPFVDHFRQIWTACFTGFLRAASKPGDVICFTPELLPSRIYYARVFDGREETDRWQQALVLGCMARECFEDARKQLQR